MLEGEGLRWEPGCAAAAWLKHFANAQRCILFFLPVHFFPRLFQSSIHPLPLMQVMYRLDGVDPEIKTYFSSVAKMILDSRNPQDALEVGAAGAEGLGCQGLLFLAAGRAAGGACWVAGGAARSASGCGGSCGFCGLHGSRWRSGGFWEAAGLAWPGGVSCLLASPAGGRHCSHLKMRACRIAQGACRSSTQSGSCPRRRRRHAVVMSRPRLRPFPVLQAALAALSGIKEAPQPRSLLTLEEGLVTLQMMSEAGRITRPQHIKCAPASLPLPLPACASCLLARSPEQLPP
jgi:hypothetical protein